MYAGFFEDGDKCPKCNKGSFHYPDVENCTCHISAPCGACENNRLECDVCGYQPDDPEYRYLPVTTPEFGAFILQRFDRPRKLDNSRIDYRVKQHTAFSQICEGVYPEWATKEDVEHRVMGSFGGRFEYFHDGKFKYIAYTD